MSENKSMALALAEVGEETVARWTRTGEAISARIDLRRQESLAEQAMRAKGKRTKVILLRQMSDLVVGAAAGLTPCKRGCNGCCHMATMVTEQEAEVIAQETGARMSVPARFNAFAEDLQGRYAGVPCTFLRDGECGIYAQRPLACRLHVTVADDNTRCKIEPGKPVRSPTLALGQYDEAVVKVLGGTGTVRYADIREFFPAGMGKGKRK